MCVDALLVDDEPLVLMVTADLLESLGWHVHAVLGGAAAISVLASPRRVDLVITDVLMPEFSGIEVAAAARQRRSDMPVVYITGFMPEALSTLIDVNSRTELVEKPFSLQTLDVAIRKVMTGMASARPDA